MLCLYIAKLEQCECKRLFIGTSANYSLLGVEYVKNVVVKNRSPSVSSRDWYFFVRSTKFARTGNCVLTDINYLQSINFAKEVYRQCSFKNNADFQFQLY